MRVAATLILSINLFHASAYAEKWYITPSAGIGELDVEQNFSITNTKDHIDLAAIGASLGYESDINFIIEADLSKSVTIDFLDADDNYELSEARLLLGYQFNISKNFKIIPKIGRSQWKLRGKEGRFLNPGPEQVRQFRDINDVRQINFKFPLSNKIDASLLIINSDYELGKVRSIRAGLTYTF